MRDGYLTENPKLENEVECKEEINRTLLSLHCERTTLLSPIKKRLFEQEGNLIIEDPKGEKLQ